MVLWYIPVALGLIPDSVKGMRAHRKQKALLRAGPLDEPEDNNEILVQVSIVQDGVVTGVDQGLLIVEDGALAFNGRRSSFSLGPQDLLQRSSFPHRMDRPVPTAPAGRPLYVYLSDRSLSLYFVPLKGKRRDRNAKERLGVLISNFVYSETTIARRQYPPLSWDPFHEIRLTYRSTTQAYFLVLQFLVLFWMLGSHWYVYPFALVWFLFDYLKWRNGKERSIREVYRKVTSPPPYRSSKRGSPMRGRIARPRLQPRRISPMPRQGIRPRSTRFASAPLRSTLTTRPCASNPSRPARRSPS